MGVPCIAGATPAQGLVTGPPRPTSWQASSSLSLGLGFFVALTQPGRDRRKWGGVWSRGSTRTLAARPVMEQGVPSQSFDSLFEAGTAPPLQDIAGKWALISGASSGIGKATACALAACGCNLVLLARRQDRLQEIKDEIERRRLPVQVRIIVGDVCADETYEALRKAGCLTEVDFLVNNAGLAKGKDPIGGSKISDWKEMLDANCFGAFRLTNEVLPGIVARGGGHVIMTGSIAGMEAYEGGSVYCATKHAAHAFMKALRYETYTKNVRCTVVAPGAVGEGTEFSEIRFNGDKAKAAAVYENMQELRATDIAAQIVWAIRQPSHVCLDIIQVMPTSQGGATRVHRGGK